MPDWHNHIENPDAERWTTYEEVSEPTDSGPAVDDSQRKPPIVAEVSALFVTQTGVGDTVVCPAHDPLGKGCSCFTAGEPGGTSGS